MKVLHVSNMWPTPEAPFSGSFVKNQIRSLEAAGLDCKTVYDTGNGIKRYKFLRRKVQAAIRDYQPDIIHSHFGFTGALVATLGEAQFIPKVVSYCGSDLNGEPGNFGTVVKWRLGVTASQWAASRHSHLIVKNSRMKEHLNPSYHAKTSVIPNGVDSSVFRPVDQTVARKELGLGEGPIVLFAGRSNNAVKNYGLAEAAVNLARQKKPDLQLRLVYDCPNHEMPVQMCASDVVVLTSLREGSPNVVKEALACDVPVVATPVGDVPVTLQAAPGCFVSTFDAHDVAAKIVQVLDAQHNEGERVDHFFNLGLDSNQIAANIIQIYDSLYR